MKMLMCGDSFTAYPKNTVKFSWVNQIEKDYDLTNLSQPGCSEYKIWKQLQSQNLDDFDFIIVSHTSPNRVYIKDHPKYLSNSYHRHADLIYTDIENSTDKTLNAAQLYFEYIFDEDYAIEMHQILCEKIENTLGAIPTIHISGFNYNQVYQFNNFVSLYDIFSEHRGDITHLTENGNLIAHEKITNIIRSTLGKD